MYEPVMAWLAELLASVFDYELRGKVPAMAFIDLGDQFLALAERDAPARGDDAHFGLVVDDTAQVRDRLEATGTKPLPGRGLRFRDPSGNVFEVVDYREIQFTKDPAVMHGMDLDLAKSPEALRELAEKGLT